MNDWSIFLVKFLDDIYWYVAKGNHWQHTDFDFCNSVSVKSMGFGIPQTWICILSLPQAVWPSIIHVTSPSLNFLIAKYIDIPGYFIDYCED